MQSSKLLQKYLSFPKIFYFNRHAKVFHLLDNGQVYHQRKQPFPLHSNGISEFYNLHKNISL